MASEGLNLAAITFTLYRNVRFVIRNGYNEDALKVFPFLGMVVMASIFVSEPQLVRKTALNSKNERWRNLDGPLSLKTFQFSINDHSVCLKTVQLFT